MPDRCQLTRPVVRRRTGFHANQARFQRLKVGQYLAASQPTADNNLSTGIDAVDLEPVLSEIKADCGNLHGGRLPSLWRFTDGHLRHIDAGSGGRPPHQESRSKTRGLKTEGFFAA
jgi:hypothetical protein